MPVWWTPALTYWLLPAALVGVPVLAAGIVAIGQDWRRREGNAARDLAARSMVYRVASVLILLVGLIEWGIAADEAVLARTLIAEHPAEFGRYINAVTWSVLLGGLLCGLGAHAVFTWRRLRAQPKSS